MIQQEEFQTGEWYGMTNDLNRMKRRMATLLSVMLLFGQVPVPATAEGTPAITETGSFAETGKGTTATDQEAVEPEVPEDIDPCVDDILPTFEQNDQIGDLQFRITAEAGVFVADAHIDIVSVSGGEELTRAVETVLGLEASEQLLISHHFWNFSSAEMNGNAQVKVTDPQIGTLRNEYPEGELSAAVLFCNPEGATAEEKAEKAGGTLDAAQRQISFRMEKTGLYDIVYIVRLPEEKQDEELKPDGEPEEQQCEDLKQEPDSETPQEQDKDTEQPQEANQTQGQTGNTFLPGKSNSPINQDEPLRQETVIISDTDAEGTYGSEGETTPTDLAPKNTPKMMMTRSVASVQTLAADYLAQGGSISYTDDSGNSQTRGSYNEITANTKVWDGSENDGWYAVTGNVTISSRVTIGENSSVNLILADSATLTIPLGISVPAGSVLNIWGQSSGSGTLQINGVRAGNAGIGGTGDGACGRTRIHGGRVNAIGGEGGAGIGGALGTAGMIEIYRGTVTATGGKGAAGIGGGAGVNSGTITIYGGTVTATGKDDGAGIGGGASRNAGTITITGGTVTATGGARGAGIGSGAFRSTGGSKDDTIEITGGTVKATGGSGGGAGIGGGLNANSGSIRIAGGQVTAAGNGGCGIGPGQNATTASITLTWNENTKNNTRISSGSYGGTVTIAKDRPFIDNKSSDKTTYWPKNYTGAKLSPLANTELIPDDQGLDSWSKLQSTITRADRDEVFEIRLTQDLKATSTDGPLNIPTGRNIVLDLNGFTLSRGLTAPQENGHVIDVQQEATLTVRDTSKAGNGKITGGFQTMEGGGIIVRGALNLESGSISGNKAARDGGGINIINSGKVTISGGTICCNEATRLGGGIVFSSSGGSLTMTGGTISDNIAGDYGGGIYVYNSTISVSGGEIVRNQTGYYGGGVYMSNSILNLSKSVKIRDNKSTKHGADNVSLQPSDYYNINVIDELLPDSHIGIAMHNYYTSIPNVISKKLSNPENVRLFESDNSRCWIGLNAEGQIVFGLKQKISFDSEGGSGSMDPVYAVGSGNPWTLPASTFIPPDNLGFAGWRVNGSAALKQPGEMIEINGDVTLTACFGIRYETETGETKCVSVDSVNIVERADKEWTDGWYMVSGHTYVAGRVSVKGAVYLILEDGAELVIPNGISVNQGNSLTIYGQHEQTGTISSKASEGDSQYKGCARIGGDASKQAGTVIICGGKIDVESGESSAGIGGGAGGTTTYGRIDIRRGHVFSQGGNGGAGIGGGSYNRHTNSYITISGGKIYAIGGNGGAGIGSGSGGLSGEIMISGGKVTAAGGSKGAGIGTGEDGSMREYIMINGGNITASGRDGGAGIGLGAGGSNQCAIVLDWTPESFSSTEISASSYSHAPIVGASFKGLVYGNIYIPNQGTIPDGETLVPHIAAYDWISLQASISAASDGGTVKLLANCTASLDDTAITIPAGKTVTIDMDGHTLDRNLTDEEPQKNGSVIINNGTLIIKGNNSQYVKGAIRGGNTTGNGGGILNNGTLEMWDVVIRENKAASGSSKGGGIYNTGTAVLYSCGITQNITYFRGGGISNEEGGLMIHACDVAENEVPDGYGGGIFTTGNGKKTTISACNINANKAGLNGGGLYISGAETEISSSTKIKNNTAGLVSDKAYGGGIFVLGAKVTLNGDEIVVSGNKAPGGGGIHIDKNTDFVMKNKVSVTNNTATATGGAGGIHMIDNTAKLTISGRPVVNNNGAVNLYLATGCQVTMGGTLNDSASIGVSSQKEPGTSTPVEITTKLYQTRDKDRFFSDKTDYIIGMKPDGGAILGYPAAITYIIGQNVGNKEGSQAVQGSTIILEECKEFDNLKAGIRFVGWLVNNSGKIQTPGTAIPLPQDLTMLTGGITLRAVFSVPYIDVDGKEQRKNCMILTDDHTSWQAGANYGYAVIGSVNINNKVYTAAGTELILCDGCELTTRNSIEVGSGASLTIWGQTRQSGKLNARCEGYNNAAIGGWRDCGTITINGGTIDARGNNSRYNPGIGAGNGGWNAGNITINRGTVTAVGGSGCAGIGGSGGGNGNRITINGGNVTATGGDNAAAIGGGAGQEWKGTIDGGDSGTITITGGTIKAVSGNGAAAIGSGWGGKAQDITITGGTITAEARGAAAGIGCGEDGSITGTISISGGNITAKSGNNAYPGIGGRQGSGKVILTWNDQSSSTMRVYSNQYTGTVQLERAFRNLANETEIIYPGPVTSFSYMAGKTIVPCTQIRILTWKMLQEAINTNPEGTVLQLAADIRAEKTDTHILVDGGRNIILDLNGHTMDRNLASGSYDNVVTVGTGSSLTVQDSIGSGVIRGGHPNKYGKGGAFSVTGKLIIEGGTIRDNYAYYGGAAYVGAGGQLLMKGGAVNGNSGMTGGAIYIYNNATATITGGSITGNSSNSDGGAIYNAGTLNLYGGQITGNSSTNWYGGGIYHRPQGVLNIQGSPVVQNNQAGQSGKNLYTVKLDGSNTLNIHVTGKLSDTARIGISTDEVPVIVTSGLSGKGNENHFTSDRDGTIITLNGEGEAVIGQGALITFQPGRGTGTEVKKTVALNIRYTLPGNLFTAPTGVTFDGWQVNGAGDVLPAGTAYSITGNVRFVAHYADFPYDVWVNGIQVRDSNKQDILGDGKAQYNPDTGTLTLNGAAITAGYNVANMGRAGIYAAGNLTVSGSGTISAPDYGIYTQGNLILNQLTGTFTMNNPSGANTAIQADGSLTVSGGKITVTEGYNGLSAEGNIAVHNSTLDLSSAFCPLASNDGSVTIDGENTRISARRTMGTIYSPVQAGYEQELNIASPLSIVLPEGGISEYGQVLTARREVPEEVLIAKYIHVTGVRIQPEKAAITSEETLQLQAVIAPENAANRKVTWKSSSESVAKVDENGLVTPVSEGETVITVTTEDGRHTGTATVGVTMVNQLHDITIEGTLYGTVTSSVSNARQHETVTLTVTPDEGYHTAELYYTFGNIKKDIPVSTGEFTMPDKDVTVHAAFELNSFTVAFDANGGSGDMANMPFTWGTAQQMNKNAFELAGYAFSGWNTAADGSGTSYTDEASVRNLTTEHEGVVTLYAQWVIPTYSVTVVNHHPELGTVKAEKTAGISEGEVVIMTVTPKMGYHVSTATYTPKGGTSEDILNLAEFYLFVMPAEDVTVDFDFAISTYTIVFFGNSAEVTGKMDPIQLTYGEEIQLPLNQFARNGYTFAGWEYIDDDDRTSVIADGARVSNLTAQHGSRVLLVTRWNINSYTLTFDPNGGKWETSADPITETAAYQSSVISPDDPAREGYTFAGWKQTAPTASDETATFPVTMPANDLTFTAQWTINSYTLTFDANGGTFANNDSSIYTITGVYQSDITPPTLKARTSGTYNYEFLGWDAAVTSKMPGKNMIFKARWSKSAAEHTIYFDTAGGTYVAPISAGYGTDLSQPSEPKKEGYEFAGWEPAMPATMPDKDQTLRAVWTIKQYTITFDTDGGNVIDPITKDYGSAIVPPTDPTREGYSFVGWERISPATSSITAIPSTMPAVDLSFRAKWVINSYTLTFDANGGIFISDNQAVHTITGDYASDVTAPTAAEMTRTGYEFTGWEPAVPEKIPAGDRTFRAKWELTNYAITILPSANGTVTTHAANYHMGDTVTVYSKPADTYRVASVSWQPDGGSATMILENSSGGYSFVMPAADVTVSATFEPIPVASVMLISAPGTVIQNALFTVVPIVLPLNANNKAVTWASSDPSVVQVTDAANGRFKAVSIGECTLTVTTQEGNFQASCMISVSANPDMLYRIRVNAAEHGRILAGTEQAPADSTVALTPDPDEGYSLSTLRYEYDLRKKHTVEELAVDGTPMLVMPTADITVSATFAPNIYTIRFNTAGGTLIDPIIQEYGTYVQAPADPVRPGYTFLGWDQAVPEFMPAGDMTITALWRVNRYTIIFDTDGGSLIDPVTQDYGTAIAEPAAPTKTGFTFIGWDKAVPTTMPDGDMTIKAMWQVNRYSVTFRSSGGLVGRIERNYGEPIERPADPVATGFEFAGWTPALPATMPAENLIVRALWIPIEYPIFTFADPSQGTVTASVTEGRYGEYVEITALPFEGYAFVSVTVYSENGVIQSRQVSGKTNVYEFSMPAGPVVIYATFKSTAEPTRHNVNVDTSIVGGKITPDRDTAALGETVHVNVVPETGYELTEIKYHYSYGNDEIGKTEKIVNIDTGYSFTMKDNDVTIYATFSKANYNISAESDGHGTVTSDKEKAQYKDPVTLTVTPEPGYRLYTLTYTPAGGNVTNIPLKEGVYEYSIDMPAADVMVRAVFDRIPVSGVTISQDNGSMRVDDELALTAAVQPADALIQDITWESSNASVATVTGTVIVTDDGTVYSAKVKAVGTGDVTIYAVSLDGGFRATCRIHVMPAIVRIQFEADHDNVTGEMPDVWVNRGEAWALPDHGFTVPAGYNFIGWKWESSEGNRSGVPGETIIVTENLTLRAIWGYAVATGNIRHGTITANPVGGYSGEQITLAPVPDEGYHLVSLTCTDANGQKVEIRGETFTMPDGPVTVNAVFAPNQYAIQYLPNTPEGAKDTTEQMADQALRYDEVSMLAANTYAFTGYDFAGWNTEADGTGTAYYDGQRIARLIPADGGIFRLYAQWIAVEYTITAHAEHGQVAADCGNTARYGDEIELDIIPDHGFMLESVVVVRTGKDGIQRVDRIEGGYSFNMPACDIVLYAVFIPKPYEVRFDPGAEDADGEMEPQNFIYGEEQELAANTFKRAGYVFAGWKAEEDDTIYSDRETVKNLTEDYFTTLFAQWTPAEYQITVVPAKGEDGEIRGSAEAIPGTAHAGETVQLKIEPLKGYKTGFVILMDADWNIRMLQPDKDGYYTFTMPQSNMTVGVTFMKYAYTIVFDANGGTGEMAEAEAYYGTEIPLPKNEFIRAHATFLRWNTKADGTGRPYYDEDRVKNLSEEDGGLVTLYALWEPTEYTIIFMDGETEISRVTDVFGAAITAPEDPKKEGYVFAGWDPEAPATIPETPEEGLVIRATWKEAPEPEPEPAPAPEPEPQPEPEPEPEPAPEPEPEPEPEKAEGEDAEPPAIRSRGTKSIKIRTRDGEEYSIDGGKTWQDSAWFTGLKEDTVYEIIARKKETATTKAGKPSRAVRVKTLKPGVSVAVVLNRTQMNSAETDGTAEELMALANSQVKKLQADERIRKLREKYGKDRVLLIGCLDPANVPAAEDGQDPHGLLAETLKEMHYDAVIPDADEFDVAWIDGCLTLAAQEIPVTAANLYYDGTDGEHPAGENVLTPYAVKTVTVNGHEHRIGILGLMSYSAETEWNGEGAPDGFLYVHPENAAGTLGGEAAIYLEQMREDGCEAIVVCCFGKTEMPEGLTETEAAEWTGPAEALVKENAGIHLVLTGCGVAEKPGQEEVKDRGGKKVPVVYCGEEPDGLVFALTENKAGELQVAVQNEKVR